MSASNFKTSIPIFNGAQGEFYLMNGIKYHVNFPLAWALNHLKISCDGAEDETGPHTCGNCNMYGSIRGVFVGYCGNCLLLYHNTDSWRGCLVEPGLPVEFLEDKDMWARFPYMSGVPKSAIGDEEGADLTDQGINLEKIHERIDATIACDFSQDEEAECEDGECDDEEKMNNIYKLIFY